MRGRPPTPAEAEARVSGLLSASEERGWHARSQALAESYTWGRLVREHAIVRALHELPVDPAGFCLELFEAGEGGEVADECGPFSDFDPVNAIPFASIESEGIWYSLLAIPGEAPGSWPVLECEPSGDDNVRPVAIDLNHFLHEWFYGTGPFGGTPLGALGHTAARSACDVVAARFAIDAEIAMASWEARDEGGANVPGAPAAVPASALAPLVRLCVFPDD